MAFDPVSGDLWEQENGDDSLQRDQPRRAGLQLRLGAGDGPARPRRAVQGDRDDPRPNPPDPTRRRLLRPAAGALGSDEHRRHAARGATTAWSSSPARASATRRWPGSTRSPRAASTSSPRVSSARTTRATCSSAPPAAPCAAATSSGSASRTTARRSTSRRQAPARPGRRQQRQVRDHRERVAALRRELRRHAGPQGEPGRHALRRVHHAGHGLRDPPQVAPINTRVAGNAPRSGPDRPRNLS